MKQSILKKITTGILLTKNIRKNVTTIILYSFQLSTINNMCLKFNGTISMSHTD